MLGLGVKAGVLPFHLLCITPCCLSTVFDNDGIIGGSVVRCFREADPRRVSCRVVGHLLLEVLELIDALLRLMCGILS